MIWFLSWRDFLRFFFFSFCLSPLSEHAGVRFPFFLRRGPRGFLEGVSNRLNMQSIPLAARVLPSGMSPFLLS